MQVPVISLMTQHHMHAILICQIYCRIWNIIKNLIIWFEANYLKLIQGKWQQEILTSKLSIGKHFSF